MRHETEHKSFEKADETREFSNGRAEILTIGGADVGRLVLEPGWRWANDVKPIAQTESCEAHASPSGTFARVDPEHRRTVRNDGPAAGSVLIVSAPRSSGYEPMGWA